MKGKSGVFIFVIIMIACCIFLTGCGWVTVVPIDKDAEKTPLRYQEKITDLDPKVYAEESWPEILEYAKNNSQPVEEVVPLFLQDQDAAGEQYGYRMDDNSWWQFIVAGEAKVLKYNIESKAGVLELDLKPYDGIADCNLQIGPIIKGQAIRDAMPFIQFKDFVNQLQFGKIASEINNYARETVIDTVVTPDIEGKTISFTGAYTAEPGRGIIIVPIELTVSGE